MRSLHILVALLVPLPLTGQVHGTVVDPAGHPLADAVVDLWTPTARVGRVVTSTSGRFAFDSLRGGNRLVARRIGSLSLVRPVGATEPGLTLTLLPAQVELAAIEVTGKCTSREDAAARRAWARAAAWYRPLPDSLWLASWFKAEGTRVPADEAERPDIDSMGYGLAGYRALAVSTYETSIVRSGYPAPDPARDEVVSGSLVPAELQHLVSPFFGARVRFTLLEDDRVRFCPRDHRHPWIEGEFKLAEDGSLLWARWKYGSNVEGWGTGAVATFLAPAADRGMPLLTSTFLTWQERGSGMVARWAVEFREWLVSRDEPRDWRAP